MSMNRKLNELVEEIGKERAGLLECVAGLSQEQTQVRPEPEDWSVGEVLDHLHIIETRVVRLFGIHAAKAAEQGLGPDLSEESVLDSLDQFKPEVVTVKIKAPEAVAPRHGMGKNELLAGLETSRADLLDSVQKLSQYDLKQLIQPHPVFGPLNLYQWILLVGKHEHRHATQIKQIRQCCGFPESVDLSSEEGPSHERSLTH
jgi:hypothetical protein